MCEQFLQLVEKVPAKIYKLEELAQNRKHFENDVDEVSQWLTETEASLAHELKTESLNDIEEQLEKVPVSLTNLLTFSA